MRLIATTQVAANSLNHDACVKTVRQMGQNLKRRKKLRAPKQPREKYSQESRGAEWVTIGWLLATMTTLAAETAGLLAYALSGDSEVAGVFSRYIFFSAMVIGLIAALQTPFVYRLRNVPPPRGVTIAVLVISLAPLAIWAAIFGF